MSDWFVQGVPIRLELGPRDMAGQVCMSARRDTGVKASISWADLPQQIPQLLDTIQVTADGKDSAKHAVCQDSTGYRGSAPTWDRVSLASSSSSVL